MLEKPHGTARQRCRKADKIVTVSEGAQAPPAALKQDHSCSPGTAYIQLCIAAGDI